MAVVTSSPAEIIFDLLNDNWATKNVAKPKIKVRETAEELREQIPSQGLVLVYAESGGIRISPRGNRLYRDELVNVNIEVHTVKSHAHWYDLIEEILRIIESKTHDVSPFHETRPLTVAEEYGATFRYWKGNVRVELQRVAVRTSYSIP